MNVGLQHLSLDVATLWAAYELKLLPNVLKPLVSQLIYVKYDADKCLLCLNNIKKQL